MSFNLRPFVVIVLLFLSATAAAVASPADSKVLALVPEGAQFVAGIEDPHNPPVNGWLLLLSRKTSLDLQDWISLSGVDPQRRADEIIEVAASFGGQELSQHLVLLAGQFDGELIYRAALANGASVTQYCGQHVLVVKPFAREKGTTAASRWMAVIDDHLAIFGSPGIVRRALDRYRSKSGPDPRLVHCLRDLHKDVESWNVLLMSSPMFARNVESEQLHAPWTHILDGADEFTFGIHYGSTDRIDFAVHVVSSQKASYLSGLLAEARVLPVDLSTSMRPRLQSLSIEQNGVRGSFLVSARKFGPWLASGSDRQILASNSQPRP